MTRDQEINRAAMEALHGDPRYMDSQEMCFTLGAHWADAHPDISVVSALAYKAGREDAINDAGEWLKGNLHLAIDCDDEGRYHIDPNFVGYFKVRMGKGCEK